MNIYRSHKNKTKTNIVIHVAEQMKQNKTQRNKKKTLFIVFTNNAELSKAKKKRMDVC